MIPMRRAYLICICRHWIQVSRVNAAGITRYQRLLLLLRARVITAVMMTGMCLRLGLTLEEGRRR